MSCELITGKYTYLGPKVNCGSPKTQRSSNRMDSKDGSFLKISNN